jgi:hypothetical protein
MIDHGQMARFKGKGGPVEAATGEAEKAKKRQENWLRYRNEALWTRIY